MIGAISGGFSYVSYGGLAPAAYKQAPLQPQASQNTAVIGAYRSSDPETPVQPVTSAPIVTSGVSGNVTTAILNRHGADPAEMAVRMRIQHGDPSLPPSVQQNSATNSKSAQEWMEEQECQTCENRTYQDGSDDPSVSFQTPGHIDPDNSASIVRAHEMEHVFNERAQASREDRRVISQSVTLKNSICPECGKVYVSGGTTYTKTAAAKQPKQTDENKPSPFLAYA